MDTDELGRRQPVSKLFSEYSQSTRGTAALERADHFGFDRYPGQDVEYVVVNEDALGGERVGLAFKECDRYDAGFYENLSIQACESVVSPLGWRSGEIREEIDGMSEVQQCVFKGNHNPKHERII